MINVNFINAGKPYERCAFCRTETDYWFLEKDVAVCHHCAVVANPEDVPDKKDWCIREEIAEESLRNREIEALDAKIRELSIPDK